jgi:hypothetical protein
MKNFASIFKNFDPAIIERDVGGIVRANLVDIAIAARGAARVRSGFMRESINYEMLGPMAGVTFCAAPYGFRQEKGFTTPTGGTVTPNNFFIPNAVNGMRQFVADMQLFLRTLISGGTFSPRPIRPLPRGSVLRKSAATAAGRNTHKYLRKIALGGGKFRYVYATGSTGTVSRFGKVFRPGTGKGFQQVGRRRRVV